METTIDKFLETKSLTVKSPLEGYTIPYAYLKTLIAEFSDIQNKFLQNEVKDIDEKVKDLSNLNKELIQKLSNREDYIIELSGQLKYCHKRMGDSYSETHSLKSAITESKLREERLREGINVIRNNPFQHELTIKYCDDLLSSNQPPPVNPELNRLQRDLKASESVNWQLAEHIEHLNATIKNAINRALIAKEWLTPNPAPDIDATINSIDKLIASLTKTLNTPINNKDTEFTHCSNCTTKTECTNQNQCNLINH